MWGLFFTTPVNFGDGTPSIPGLTRPADAERIRRDTSACRREALGGQARQCRALLPCRQELWGVPINRGTPKIIHVKGDFPL